MLSLRSSTHRSNQHRNQAISKGKRAKWSKWTPAEDADLLALVEEHGAKNWHFISSHMKTERSDDSCCGRWMHYLQPKSAGKGGAGVGKDEAEVEKPGDPVASTSAASPGTLSPSLFKVVRQLQTNITAPPSLVRTRIPER